MITKSDLAEVVEFDWETAYRNIQTVRPEMRVFRLSSKASAGMDEYMDSLAQRLYDSRKTQAV